MYTHIYTYMYIYIYIYIRVHPNPLLDLTPSYIYILHTRDGLPEASLAARYLEKKLADFLFFIRAPPPCYPGLTRG